MKKHHLLTFTSLLTLTCSLNAASRIEKRTEPATRTQAEQNLAQHNEEHAPESMIASSSSKNEKSNYSIPQDEASVPAAPRTPQPNRAPEPVENQPAAPAPQPVAPTRPRTPPASVPPRSPQPRPEPAQPPANPEPPMPQPQPRKP